MNPTDPVIPIVQNALTAANSIRLGFTHWHDVKAHGQQALAAARKAGEAFILAKSQCPHGEWMDLVDQTAPGSRRTVARCMRIALHWAKVEAADGITAALQLLVEEPPEHQSGHGDQFDATVQTAAGSTTATTSGTPAKNGSSGNSGGAGKGTAQGRFDFDGTGEKLKQAQAAIAIKKKLAEEAHAALGQLLEVLPKLSTGTMGPEFAELATAAGLGPVPQKSERGEFVGPRLVATETYTDRFPPLEALREATAAFLKKFGAES